MDLSRIFGSFHSHSFQYSIINNMRSESEKRFVCFLILRSVCCATVWVERGCMWLKLWSRCVCMFINGAQCEINLNCNHNCHSIHCTLLLLLLYSYVMCSNKIAWLSDATQWSIFKGNDKGVHVIIHLRSTSFSLYRFVFFCHRAGFFHHLSSSHYVCSTLYLQDWSKTHHPGTYSQLFSFSSLETQLHWYLVCLQQQKQQNHYTPITL